MVAILFRGEGKWGVQRTLHQFSHHLVCSISAAEAAHMHFDAVCLTRRATLFALLSEQSLFEFGSPHGLVWRVFVQVPPFLPLCVAAPPRAAQPAFFSLLLYLPPPTPPVPSLSPP